MRLSPNRYYAGVKSKVAGNMRSLEKAKKRSKKSDSASAEKMKKTSYSARISNRSVDRSRDRLSEGGQQFEREDS